ncbi:MAG: UDP-glucose 4-epimerase GalE [Planctomycetota bacterium]
MRVLVTGGAGYVGCHVVRALQRAGHSPLVLDDLSTGHMSLVERAGAPLLVGDVGDPAFLDQVFGGHALDAVVHCAGKAVIAESVRAPERYFLHNTVAGFQLLEAMRRHAVSRLVFSSTCAVYGVPERLPVTEASPCMPVNPYGASKLAFERMMVSYARAYGFRALALRYFNVAGASAEGDLGELDFSGTRLIPNLLRAARGGTTFQINGANYPTRDGTAERDYIHVEDLAEAHARAVSRLDILDPLAFGCALNLGTGTGHTVREVLAAVEQQTGQRLTVREVPRRPGDPPALVASPGLAERVLGFRCHHSLDSMVRSAHAFSEGERAREGSPLREARPRPQDAGRKLRFGEAIVQAGFLTPEVVEEALAVQRERDGVGESHQLLGLILLEMGAISSAQLIEALRRMSAPAPARADGARK